MGSFWWKRNFADVLGASVLLIGSIADDSKSRRSQGTSAERRDETRPLLTEAKPHLFFGHDSRAA